MLKYGRTVPRGVRWMVGGRLGWLARPVRGDSRRRMPLPGVAVQQGRKWRWAVAPVQAGSAARTGRPHRGAGALRHMRRYVRKSHRGLVRWGSAPTRKPRRQLHIRGSPQGGALGEALKGR